MLLEPESSIQFDVYGNAADDVGDTIHAGRIIIHADARDVIGQALQGGDIFVRGSVGNRAGIQMREYGDRRPFLIVGGGTDDYLGEYMAGGVIAVLGLDANAEKASSLVGDFVGKGMVGGKIFIRGKLKKGAVGLPPPTVEVSNYLHSLFLDGLLSRQNYERITKLESLDYFVLKENLEPTVFHKVERFYEGKYTRPPYFEYRDLNSEEYHLLEPKLKDYFDIYGLSTQILDKVFASKYTVVTNEDLADHKATYQHSEE